MEASARTERAWRAIRVRWDQRYVNVALVVLLGLSALLILFETRGNVLANDDLTIFQELGPGITGQRIVAPHFGHLIIAARVVYAAVFTTAGPDYRILRVIGVLAFLACCTAFFVLVRRRVGGVLALGFTAVLLFLGSSWETLLWPLSMLTFVLALAFGFGALIALDRDDRIGDVAACVLTALAVGTHSTGLAFLAGVAVSVLLRGDRARRAWIFLVPLGLYAAWWIWALKFDESLVHPQNLLLIAPFIADSLGAAGSGITGLSPGLTHSGVSGFSEDFPWGPVLALVAAAAFAFRLSRGAVPRTLWVSLAIVIAFWITLTLALGGGRAPATSRYMFPDVALVLLLASEALAGIPLRPVAVAVIVAVFAGGVLSNIRELTVAAPKFRDYSPETRAALAAVEIARNTVSPDFNAETVPALRDSIVLDFPLRPQDYLVAVDRFGSYAFSPDQLAEQPSNIREHADQVLAAAERLTLTPARGLPPSGCTTVSSSSSSSPVIRRLPPGTTVLEAKEPTHVDLGRFADDEPVILGDLPPNHAVALKLPRDGTTRPWRIALTGPRPVRVCGA